jgi:hypothetical protein
MVFAEKNAREAYFLCKNICFIAQNLLLLPENTKFYGKSGLFPFSS